MAMVRDVIWSFRKCTGFHLWLLIFFKLLFILLLNAIDDDDDAMQLLTMLFLFSGQITQLIGLSASDRDKHRIS